MSPKSMEKFARGMRLDIVELVYRAGKEGAHLGGCLSLVDILTVLYCKFLRFDVKNPAWELRDRLILSKAHASIGLYAAMHQAGLLSDEQIALPLYGDETFLYKHSRRDVSHGIEMSGGSLGQGLSFALGIALALQRKGNNQSRVYAIVGDGECNEGSIWEAAALAGHLHQKNLTVIVDKNGLQLDGSTREILNMDNMDERWRAFGFDAKVVDGHDREAISSALAEQSEKPVAVIAQTIKGKGVSFAENNVDWHDNVLTEELYAQALREVELHDGNV